MPGYRKKMMYGTGGASMKAYKKGGVKKMKKKLPKAQPGRQTGKAIQNFYSKADAFLDNMFPGRQARQDMRGEAKAYRQAARLDRKKGRVDARMQKFYNRKFKDLEPKDQPFNPPPIPLGPQEPSPEPEYYTNMKKGGKYGHGGQWTRNPKGSRRCM
tara:strand:+ start:17329 stop:17799 length:471 start_codon:yes stop_codon:yes gene_type:complete